MNPRMMFSMAVVLCFAGVAGAQVGEPLSLATAQSIAPASVTATGHLQAVTSARISSRLSGQLMELGRDSAGSTLDAGMMVSRDQMLFRLNDTTFANSAAAAEAALASAEAALANLKAKTREEELEQRRQAVAELDLRIADKEKDFGRYQRLVEVDKTLPEKRLEEVKLELSALRMQRQAAAARLQEAENGATKTEIAMAEARVKEAQVMVKSTHDDLRDTVIRAPFDGLIKQRFKSVGDYIAATPPTEVLEIISLDNMEVEFRLPESYLTRLREGVTPVRISSPLLAAPLELKLTRIIRDIDPARGTFASRTVVPSAVRTGLMPGAFVTVELPLPPPSGDVIIPQRGLLQRDGKASVFIAVEGKMQEKAVIVGDRLTEGVLIKSGVGAGEKVIVGPAELLKDGAPLPAYLTPRAGGASSVPATSK